MGNEPYEPYEPYERKDTKDTKATCCELKKSEDSLYFDKNHIKIVWKGSWWVEAIRFFARQLGLVGR